MDMLFYGCRVVLTFFYYSCQSYASLGATNNVCNKCLEKFSRQRLKQYFLHWWCIIIASQILYTLTPCK